MDINRKHIFRKRENRNVWLVLVTWGTQKFYKSLNTLVNGGNVILKNLKAKLLENEGVDENEAKFCTIMAYKLADNMIGKVAVIQSV